MTLRHDSTRPALVAGLVCVSNECGILLKQPNLRCAREIPLLFGKGDRLREGRRRFVLATSEAKNLAEVAQCFGSAIQVIGAF